MRANFARIVSLVRESAPDVRPTVLRDDPASCLRLDLWLRPTLVVAPRPPLFFRTPRGAVCRGRHLTKSAECAALGAAGVPVPRWTLLTPDREPDLSGFGPYVVTKPDFGSRGAGVRIQRRGRVRWKPPESIDGRHPGILVQEFVYTGRWPVAHRVTTLFGRTLFAVRTEADRSRRPLLGRDAFRGGPEVGGVSIVSSHRGCTYSLGDDPEVIALAERAHDAFPDIPVLGVDVLRDADTGRLSVIETNPGGYTWHFSSKPGRRIQQQFGLDLEAQFDGIRKAAGVLAEETRRRAR
jgi:hypothetical protein